MLSPQTTAASVAEIATQQLSEPAWIPADNELVLEYIPVGAKLTPAQKLLEIEATFKAAVHIGYAKRYSNAKDMLALLSVKTFSPAQQIRYWYLQAQLLQEDQQFESALDIINQIPIESEYYLDAQLMAAQIQLTQGHRQLSRSHCQQLLSGLGADFVTLCVLQTKVNDPNTRSSFAQLYSTAYNQYLDRISSQLSRELTRFAVNIAWAGGDRHQALNLLESRLQAEELIDALLWLDIILENPSATDLSRLAAFYHQWTKDIDTAELTDALVLRLARAEQQLNIDDHLRKVAASRIKQRLDRGDFIDPIDFAYFFIYIDQQPRYALYWARRNFSKSKNEFDKQLFEQAKLINLNATASRP